MSQNTPDIDAFLEELKDLLDEPEAAPQAEPALPDAVAGSISVTAGKRGSLLQVKGQLPEIDENSPIYVVCGDTAYEAFCLEQSGFGLYLDPECAPEYAVCTVNGVPAMYKIEITK